MKFATLATLGMPLIALATPAIAASQDAELQMEASTASELDYELLDALDDMEADVDPERLMLASQFVALIYQELLGETVSESAAPTDVDLMIEVMEIDELSYTSKMKSDLKAEIEKTERRLEQMNPLFETAVTIAYADTYTADELLAFIDFANTPAGKRFFAASQKTIAHPAVAFMFAAYQAEQSNISSAIQRFVCKSREHQLLAMGETDATCSYG